MVLFHDYFYDYSPGDIIPCSGRDGRTMKQVMWKVLGSHLDACISLFLLLSCVSLYKGTTICLSIYQFWDTCCFYFWQLWTMPLIPGGNGNPLQCSCLENPRDGGAWWAAVYGVAQSWTRLKWLSSSSSIQWLTKRVSFSMEKSPRAVELDLCKYSLGLCFPFWSTLHDFQLCSDMCTVLILRYLICYE